MAEFTESEKSVLQSSKILSEGVQSPFWREVQRLLMEHMRIRQQILLAPIAVEAGVEVMGKVMQLEAIKGALDAYQTIFNLPQNIIDHAADIRRTNSAGDSNG